MPWILDYDNDIRRSLSDVQIPSSSELKMQALGVDSYYISQRLTQLLYAPDTLYRGVLGKLSKDAESNNLERNQIWARFNRGQPRRQTQ